MPKRHLIEQKLSEMQVEVEKWLRVQELLLPHERLEVSFEIIKEQPVAITLYRRSIQNRRSIQRLFKSDMAEEFAETDWQELLKFNFGNTVRELLEQLHKTGNKPVHIPSVLYNKTNFQLQRQGTPFRLMSTTSGRGVDWEYRVCRMYKKK